MKNSIGLLYTMFPKIPIEMKKKIDNVPQWLQFLISVYTFDYDDDDNELQIEIPFDLHLNVVDEINKILI